ncbi:hypothetical protein CLU91_5517 [Janthinobacterium sp. 64]|nr:hypothetical protein CLU91_5517 [Janthinobacterium sp. 64]
MSLSDKTVDFSGALAIASTDAPDDYPDWGSTTYASNMEDLKDLWAEIRATLKKDLDKVPFIDAKLQEAFFAFDSGEKEKGRKAILAIYNLEVKKLR